MIRILGSKLGEVLKAVMPLIAVVTVLQMTVIHAPIELFIQFLVGSALAIAGMILLFLGIDLGILPMGRFIGAELPRRGSLLLIVGVAFATGFATTVAEPDVLVLATQIGVVSGNSVSGQVVLYAVGIGVAVLTAVAMVRIIFGWSIRMLITGAYLLMLLLAFLAPADFVPMAFDAGSVTTGVLTAPVVIALAIGLSSVLAGRSAITDGFGLLGLASTGAILAVLGMGLVWQ
ncbi:DUF1538 domain-containing protein [Pseudorhizobium sp. NPDC055634]